MHNLEHNLEPLTELNLDWSSIDVRPRKQSLESGFIFLSAFRFNDRRFSSYVLQVSFDVIHNYRVIFLSCWIKN